MISLNFKPLIKKIKIPFLSPVFVAFDLGTSNSHIGIVKKGVVINEATIVGINKRDKKYTFFGDEAKKIRGKTPDFIKIINPLENSVISDFNSTVALINYFLEKGVSPYLSQYKMIKPPIFGVASVPKIATEIEQKAVEEAINKNGVFKTYLIEKPVAIVAGMGENITLHSPKLIIDIGGGKTEVSIVSGGGIVDQKSIKKGGKDMDKKIMNYLYLKHGIILGLRTCEELKINLLNFKNKEKTVTIRGKSLETRLPKSIKVKTSDIKEALINDFNQIVDTVKELLEISAPEIVNEIINKGIIITGGMAKIEGIENFFQEELKIKTIKPDKPDLLVIKGLLRISEDENLLSILKL